MKYATDNRDVVEWIWNSRDGVTPFCITTRDGKREMQHIDFGGDIYSPEHRPQAGERIFVDMSRDKAEAIAREAAPKRWERLSEQDKQRFGSIDNVAQIIADDLYGDGKSPALIVVVDEDRAARRALVGEEPER